MYSDVNGTKIYYLKEGSKEPVILLHGMSDNSNIWIPLMPYLSKDYKVFAIDLRGHGHSAKPLIEYSLEMFSGDLLGFMDNMDIDEVSLIGHSLGAAIAQDFAANYPERLNKLILLSPFSYVDNVLENALLKLKLALEVDYFEFFEEAVKLVNTPEFIQENEERIETIKIQSQKINPPEIMKKVIDACLSVDIRQEVTIISQKTFIIAGSEDKMIHLSQFQNIHENIRNSEMVILEGVAHNLFGMDNMEKLSDMMLNFLKK